MAAPAVLKGISVTIAGSALTNLTNVKLPEWSAETVTDDELGTGNNFVAVTSSGWSAGEFSFNYVHGTHTDFIDTVNATIADVAVVVTFSSGKTVSWSGPTTGLTLPEGAKSDKRTGKIVVAVSGDVAYGNS